MEKELESQYKHQNIELIKMCEHEVSVKNRRTQSYRWLICGCIITEKPIVKEKYILIINRTNKQFIDEESYI